MKCKKCGKEFEYIHRNVCKICDFKRRRKEDLDTVLCEEKWKEKELDIVFQKLLYKETSCINDLLIFLDDKNLEDMVDLLSNKIHIGGVEIKIRMSCSYCKKEYFVTISKYLEYKEKQGGNYCSRECSYTDSALKLKNAKRKKLEEESKIKYVKCPSCNKIFKKEQIGVKSKTCLVCNTKNIHKEEYENILNVGFWKKGELDLILYSLNYEKEKTVDEIILELNTNKKLEDIIKLLSEDLKLGGSIRKRMSIKCNACDKPMKITFAEYNKSKSKNKKFYCSTECMGIGRLGKYTGENSPKYNKHDYRCDYCNKPIKVRNYRCNTKRKDGSLSNHFCSKLCSNKFRSKNYSGENHPMYGVKFDKQRIESMREIGAQSIKMIPCTLTKPHITINELLHSMKIKYTNEHLIKYYSLDIYLDDYLLGIEIMGDYWHCNPVSKYNKNPTKLQSDNIRRDKSKHTYIKKYNNFEILYLWEKDIINNKLLCELLINEYIRNNGILKNYNSFNYYVNDNEELLLNENIIKIE